MTLSLELIKHQLRVLSEIRDFIYGSVPCFLLKGSTGTGHGQHLRIRPSLMDIGLRVACSGGEE